MTVETLLETYGVDRDHARHVADLCLVLFDQLQQVHGMPSEARRLLEIGALLHNVGLNENPAQHHTVGRDIVLRTSMEELTEDERAMVACLVAFHRKKVRPEREPVYLGLKKKDRETTLRLAALLRIADGLDSSQSQTTRIECCNVADTHVQLHLTGRNAEADGARAIKKADLWQQLFSRQITYFLTPIMVPSMSDDMPMGAPNGHQAEHLVVETAGVESEPSQREESIQPVYDSAEPVAVASRRMLRRQFKKLQSEEKDVRADKDTEAVHQMRVATRRLRAVLAIIAEVAPPKQVRLFRKAIQRVAQASSAVRDCDVFLEHIADYATSLPEEQRAEMQPLVSALHRDRAAAHVDLLKQLDTRRYADFKRDFALFMTDEQEGWNITLRVRDIAGSLIWQRYENVRAYETRLDLRNGNGVHEQDGELHETRIAGKRLRYVLEMFADYLGPGVNQVLATLKQFQDQLGTIHDIAVTKAYIAQLDLDLEGHPALKAYIASREEERTRLLATLPYLWAELTGEGYRRQIMELIVCL